MYKGAFTESMLGHIICTRKEYQKKRTDAGK